MKAMQIDIFGKMVTVEKADPPQDREQRGRPKRATMNEMYGSLENEKCGNCAYLIRYGYRSAVYFKCEKWAVTHSTATDKRKKDIACKLFERKER